MRTTLDIDDDVLDYVKETARGNKMSVGKALSNLARRGINSRIQLVEKDGVYMLPKTVGGSFGPEDVQALLDSEYDDYWQRFGKPESK